MNESLPFHQRLIESIPCGSSSGGRGGIDYRQSLDDLARKIRPELAQIKLTFPEYTPHDWDGHISPLFDIVQRLFGSENVLELNILDRFLLVAGLYGHDWGMAVGMLERQAIAGGGNPMGEESASMLLPDEQRRVADFARRRGLNIEADGSYPELLDESLPHWAEYVRVTHAWRSGHRMHQYLLFPNKDHALAEAGRTVCEGHWLDFEQLRNPQKVWQYRTVGNFLVHVRLVALIVRLADLFDVGRDRTPFALRRFIGPSDPTSVKEWDKHEALDPIACIPLVAGRWQVVIQGTCRSAALWPALADLRRYLDDQLRQAVGLLAEEQAFIARETSDSGLNKGSNFYRLDSALKWDVRAEGFKPIEVRFEFDRAGTFRVLTKEIYGNEPHIFLRELLQNSIDATMQLCARLEQSQDRRRPTPEQCLIHFRIQRSADGHTSVTCRDYGIGMNEHIVCHYLAQIGASYYTSDEFIRDKVSMNVISRFGIGLLSCFMVSDKIVIRSKRLPQLGGDNSGLRIEISGIERHFHVFPLDDPDWVGTEVLVDVLPTKLASFAKADGTPPEFNAGEYLKQIAGFIEVPIYIEDGERRFIILHPEANPSLVRQGVAPDAEVFQLRGDYRWNDELQKFVLCPDPKILSQYRVNVAKELGFPGISGFVTFPMPYHLRGDMQILDNGILRGENMTVQLENGENAPNVSAQSLVPSREFRLAAVPSGQLKKKVPSILVYQDGIYVVGTGEVGQKVGDDPFPAHGWLNYRSSARAELTASRSSFSHDPKQSPEWLIIHARTYAFRKELLHARILPPVDRLRKLVQIEKFLGVGNGSVIENLPWGEFPAIVLQPSGRFECVAAKEAFDGEFRIVPPALRDFANAQRVFDSLQGKSSPAALGYRGGTWLFEFPLHHRTDSIFRQSVVMLQHVFLQNALFPVALRFVALAEPWGGPQPLEVRVPRPNAKPENVRSLVVKAYEDPQSLSAEEWGRLRVGNVVDGGMPLARSVFQFPHPFTAHFSHGLDYFNLGHSAVRWMMRVAAAGALAGGINAPPGSPSESIFNWLRQLKPQMDCCYETFESHWKSMASWINRLPTLVDVSVPSCPKFDEFISGSLLMTKHDVFERKQKPQVFDFLTQGNWGADY